MAIFFERVQKRWRTGPSTCILAWAGQTEWKSRLTLSMSTVNVERVRPAGSPQKKVSATTFSGRNGILCRYFYFAMSLLLAAIVVSGFKRTVNDNLFHPAVPRPFILWIHGTAFAGWVIFFIGQSTLVRIRKVSWHRSIGWFGAGLSTVMVPLGVTTAIIMARFDTLQLHQKGADAFLSIPVLRHDRLWGADCACYLLAHETRTASAAGLHRHLWAHGRGGCPL
jgi:hypothetical protein